MLCRPQKKSDKMASPSSPQLLTNGTGMSLDDHCKKAWTWWRETLKSPRSVLAPMVDQSELTFRMLAREHGADLCYSPMVHSRIYAERDEEMRAQMFSTVPEDRPLVVQFCGNDPQTLLAAARAVQVDDIWRCTGLNIYSTVELCSNPPPLPHCSSDASMYELG